MAREFGDDPAPQNGVKCAVHKWVTFPRPRVRNFPPSRPSFLPTYRGWLSFVSLSLSFSRTHFASLPFVLAFLPRRSRTWLTPGLFSARSPFSVVSAIAAHQRGARCYSQRKRFKLIRVIWTSTQWNERRDSRERRDFDGRFVRARFHRLWRRCDRSRAILATLRSDISRI